MEQSLSDTSVVSGIVLNYSGKKLISKLLGLTANNYKEEK